MPTNQPIDLTPVQRLVAILVFVAIVAALPVAAAVRDLTRHDPAPKPAPAPVLKFRVCESKADHGCLWVDGHAWWVR